LVIFLIQWQRPCKDKLEESHELDGKLERMADFCVLWGEAAARALGSKPLDFLQAFSENQSKDAVNFNALRRT
jgi:hypothetical protein